MPAEMESSIGHQLRLAREAKGLSLEQVSHETKIPIPRLEDLEGDHLTQWGGMAYTRSFAKHYADFLGLNLDDQIHQLPIPSTMAGTHDYQYLLNNFGPWMDAQHPPRPVADPPKPSSFESKTFQLFAIFSAGVLFMLMGGLITYFIMSRSVPLQIPGDAQTPVHSENHSEPPSEVKAMPSRQSWQSSPSSDLSPQALLPPNPNSEPPVIPKAIPVME